MCSQMKMFVYIQAWISNLKKSFFKNLKERQIMQAARYYGTNDSAASGSESLLSLFFLSHTPPPLPRSLPLSLIFRSSVYSEQGSSGVATPLGAEKRREKSKMRLERAKTVAKAKAKALLLGAEVFLTYFRASFLSFFLFASVTLIIIIIIFSFFVLLNSTANLSTHCV